MGRFDWQESIGIDCHEDMYETLFSRTSLGIQGVRK